MNKHQAYCAQKAAWLAANPGTSSELCMLFIYRDKRLFGERG